MKSTERDSVVLERRVRGGEELARTTKLCAIKFGGYIGWTKVEGDSRLHIFVLSMRSSLSEM